MHTLANSNSQFYLQGKKNDNLRFLVCIYYNFGPIHIKISNLHPYLWEPTVCAYFLHVF